MNIEVLKGKTATNINVDRKNQEIIFSCLDNTKYKMYYELKGNENSNVEIEDICGDIEDLIGVPIIMAEETTGPGNEEYGTSTWTFYKLGTVKGYVTIRWYGASNGYYSENVDFQEIK